jgi:hypothetical protein
VTKVLKKLPIIPTLEQQVDLLKREVLIVHEDFKKGTAGRIVSLLQTNYFYWVLLNHKYQTKQGKWSRKKLFRHDELRLIDEK